MVFRQTVPKDPKDIQKFACIGKGCDEIISEYDTNCVKCGSNFQACVATGKPIFDKHYYKCGVCKHKMLFEAIEGMHLKYCALCHSEINQVILKREIAKKRGN